MKKSIEDKILQELIDRVIQEDRDIKERHEEEDIKNATKEALTEMTDLSLSEINKIEAEIRKTIKNKPKKSYSKYILLSILGVLLVWLLYFYFGSYRYNDRLVFTEDFNDNSRAWDLLDNFVYKKYIDKESYIFMSNKDETCFSEKLQLKIPLNFTAEITSTWLGGGHNSYGLTCSFGYASSHKFYLHPENKTYAAPIHESKESWISFPVLTENGKNTHIQKIVAKPTPRKSIYDMPYGEYNYYVNDKFISKGIYANPMESIFGMEVCGDQDISYDHIKITNDITGEILIDGPFSDYTELLKPQTEINAISKIENGSYIFTTDVKGECYRVLIPQTIKKHAKIKIKSTWLEGEDYYYGFILQSAPGTYYSFELRRDGIAYFIRKADHVKMKEYDHIETKFIGDGKTSFEQTILLKGNKLEYYINDKLILEEKHDMSGINEIGFRMCGRQSVAFDKIEIWE